VPQDIGAGSPLAVLADFLALESMRLLGGGRGWRIRGQREDGLTGDARCEERGRVECNSRVG
jgi:hypothetical protein